MPIIDGIDIGDILPEEKTKWEKWLKENKVNEPFHPDQHFDYIGAFRSGEGRQSGKDGHFFDTHKLPGHPTFSIESKYFTPGMKAGYWQGDQYVPIKDILELPSSALLYLLNKNGMGMR
jgi:hypothetical protein